MKEAFANYIVVRKSIRGRAYEAARIFIPTKLSTDSSFPFKGKRVRVLIRISGDKLIISKPKRAPNSKLAKRRRLDRGGEGRRS
ncbi:MAG: hypothetical protein QXU06_01535 [Candidatus Bathyarchaeia archaeon]